MIINNIKLFLSKIFDNKKHKESSVIIKTMENKTEFKFQIRRRETRQKIVDNKKTKKKNERTRRNKNKRRYYTASYK